MRKNYPCRKCDKVFSQKAHLDYHLYKKKTPCNDIIPPNPTEPTTNNNTNSKILGKITGSEIKSIKCDYCNKKFSRNDALKRHLTSRCTIKNIKYNEKDTLVEQLNAEIKQLKEELLSKEGNVLNNTTNNNATNQNINNGTVINNNYNFNLLPYGKENMDHLKDNDYKFIINKGFNSVNTLLEKVHFNEKVPENHNVFIGNIKNGDISVFDGKVWNLKDKKEFLDDLYDNKKNMLVDKFEELEEDLPDFTVNKFMRFQNDEKSDKISGKLKKEMKFTLYNKRHMPLDIINKNKPIIEEDNNELQKLKLEFEEFKKQVLLNK